MKRLALLALAAGSALAASAAAPDFRAPPLGSAGLATNHIMTWAGYTLGGRKNGYNDHVYLDLPENQNDLTVCSWVAVLDADGADHRPDGQGGGARRASNVLPALYYSPNIERAAPDLLGGAWGWGGSPVAVSGSLSFDYRFPAAVKVEFLEYVESTGAQYVDTGVPAKTTLASKIVLSTTTMSGCIFGAHTSSRLFCLIGGANWLQMGTGNGVQGASNTTGNRIPVGTKFTLETTQGSGNTPRIGCRIDGGPWFSSTANLTFDLGTTLLMFARRRSNTVDAYSKIKVYSARYIINGDLVRDFRPAKDAAGVAGLFDLISGQMFYSGTTTPLVAGPQREPTPEERCHALAWNGGVTGTNCFPRGVYTVAWKNLSSTMTLTAGGTDMTLEAPAGVRNVEPGEADGFVLTGSGTAQVGISRMKIEPFYKTDGGAVGGGDKATQSYDDALVSSNFCFVAHRVHLDATTHTNDLTIIQGNGSRRSWGSSPELPPDGCGSLRTNGLYQLVYSAFGDLQATFVYEWDRRQFAAWLDDDDLAAIYEDGARIRLAHNYEPCCYSNAIYQPDP